MESGWSTRLSLHQEYSHTSLCLERLGHDNPSPWRVTDQAKDQQAIRTKPTPKTPQPPLQQKEANASAGKMWAVCGCVSCLLAASGSMIAMQLTPSDPDCSWHLFTTASRIYPHVLLFILPGRAYDTGTLTCAKYYFKRQGGRSRASASSVGASAWSP